MNTPIQSGFYFRYEHLSAEAVKRIHDLADSLGEDVVKTWGSDGGIWGGGNHTRCTQAISLVKVDVDSDEGTSYKICGVKYRTDA